MNAQDIQELIEQGLPGARVQVEGADGVHFVATVVSDAFRGKLPLARRIMVDPTPGTRLGAEIRALALGALPAEDASARPAGAWARQKIVVEGGRPLRGDVRLCGGKNAGPRIRSA